MDHVASQRRRTFRRFPVQLKVPYRINGHNATWNEGRALNLSAGGVLLRAPRPSDDDLAGLLAERTRMTLDLPVGERTMRITARVVWSDDLHDSNDCRLGLRFLDLDSSAQEYLWRWVLDRVREADAN